MEGLTISCGNCERLWSLTTSFTVYEQQALESRPCPHCGLYTLSCHDLAWPTAAEKQTAPAAA